MKLKCVISKDLKTINCLGFFNEKSKLNLPDASFEVVTLEDTEFPKSFKVDHYYVVLKDSSYYLEKKSDADIEAIKAVKTPIYLEDLLAIDETILTGTLKTIVKYLKGKHGKL